MNIPARRSALRIAASLLLCGFAAVVAAQTKPKVTNLGGTSPGNILFVGNSFFYFNNSMHRYLTGIARAADAGNKGLYRSVSVTISGSGLDWHDVEAYLKPGLLGRYSFTEENKVVFNPPGGGFDLVIMSDCSQCPIHPQLKSVFHEYVKKHSQTIVKSGAKPVLMMTWAYADAPEMTAQLAEQYTLAGNACDVLVAPAGLAFAKAIAKNPAINLYFTDKRHPSMAGSYLAAATIYATLSGKSPVGVSYTGELDAKTAAFLQEVATETVKEYFGK